MESPVGSQDFEELYKDHTIGSDPPVVCENLYNEYTNDGQDWQNIFGNKTVENELDKCVYTSNKPRCMDQYNNMMEQEYTTTQGIEQASNPDFPEEWRQQLLECRDDNSWTGMGKDAWHNIKNNPFGAINDTGTAIWDGTKWVAGQGLQVGTAVAGKVWDGTKWAGASASSLGIQIGQTAKNYIYDGANWVAGTSKNIGKTVGTNIWDGAKWVAGKTYAAGTVVSDKLWDGTQWITGKALDVGTSVAGKVWDGTEWVTRQAKAGVIGAMQYVDEKTGLSAKALRWVVYVFLITQIIIEIFGTISELLGTKFSIGTRITVIILTGLQLVFAGGLLYFQKTSLEVGLWIGLVYFAAVLVGAIVSGILKGVKMNKKSIEQSKVFDIIGLVVKGVQAVACLGFGIWFILGRNKLNGMGYLNMYAMIAITITELLGQIF